MNKRSGKIKCPRVDENAAYNAQLSRLFFSKRYLKKGELRAPRVKQYKQAIDF